MANKKPGKEAQKVLDAMKIGGKEAAQAEFFKQIQDILRK